MLPRHRGHTGHTEEEGQSTRGLVSFLVKAAASPRIRSVWFAKHLLNWASFLIFPDLRHHRLGHAEQQPAARWKPGTPRRLPIPKSAFSCPTLCCGSRYSVPSKLFSSSTGLHVSRSVQPGPALPCLSCPPPRWPLFLASSQLQLQPASSNHSITQSIYLHPCVLFGGWSRIKKRAKPA